MNKIMNTAYKWRIADPWFLGIQIPSDYHVEDFRDGKQPQLNPGNFENLLRKILTARGFQNPGTYEFYYNSKYSNQQVWDQVRCNCFDGAEMIIEIASMLGLSGHMIHGSWNGIGHVAAMVNGQIYDMTQFQNVEEYSAEVLELVLVQQVLEEVLKMYSESLQMEYIILLI